MAILPDKKVFHQVKSQVRASLFKPDDDQLRWFDEGLQRGSE